MTTASLQMTGVSSDDFGTTERKAFCDGVETVYGNEGGVESKCTVTNVEDVTIEQPVDRRRNTNGVEIDYQTTVEYKNGVYDDAEAQSAAMTQKMKDAVDDDSLLNNVKNELTSVGSSAGDNLGVEKDSLA